MLKPWDKMPEWMQTSEAKQYYDILSKRKASLFLKRVFDLAAAFFMLIILSPVMAAIAVAIAADSPGGVFYRQVRVTAYGKEFRIHKFRTMVANADKIGSQVTVGNDMRITKVGAFLRKYRLDEIPQLLDVICGDMSFVGTRPEAKKYVEQYTKEMRATLLLPAGITSEASIRYKEEAMLLDAADDVERVYVEEILPEKMKYNLESIRKFSLGGEAATMLRTVFAVLGKDYK